MAPSLTLCANAILGLMNRPSFRIWRPATTHILIGGLVLLLVALVVSFVVANFKPSTELRIGNGIYHVWVADDEPERVKGLSGVKQLDANGGLLMKFDADGTWGIWMKDMEIPLDIVWLNSDKEVVYIVKNASPETSTNVVYSPKEPARYVLELPVGSVEKAGIKKGAVASFDETTEGTYRQ